MTPIQAVLAALVACGLIVAGVVILAGPAWGLIGAGGFLIVGVVLLYDADPDGAE